MVFKTHSRTWQHFVAVTGFAVILMATAISSIMMAHETNDKDESLSKTGGVLRTSAPQILVDGNTQLAATSSSGDGSAGTPYIIEDLAINASGTGSGIYIQNTNAHVIIRDCNVTGSAEGGTDAGIRLQNVTNANVTRCNSSYNGGLGIYLYNSSNNILADNVLTNNTYGIYLVLSSNSTISGNTASHNSQDGINVGGGSNNTVSGNTASYSVWNGIRLYSSNGTCSGNTVTYNHLDGIVLGGSNNTVSASTAMHNGHAGIYFSGSNNTVIGTTASYNTGHGINSNGYNYSVISGNTASYNGQDGIYVDGSHNMVSGNTASNNPLMGIVLWAGNSNSITGNTASYNQYGIYLHTATSANTVTYNVLHYNVEKCIQDDGSSNIVNSNECLENSESVPGYDAWLLCIVTIATVVTIVATRKTRRT